MNITIFASIGSQNLGDELILKNEIKILKERYAGELNVQKETIRFTVFTYDIENIFYIADNIKYEEYFPIGIKNPKNILRNLSNFFHFLSLVWKSDLIVIGGGGIFYDNEVQTVGNPLKQWLFRVKILKIFRKKIEIFRVGINISDENNLSIIKKIFSKVGTISVRDSYSLKLLTDLNVGKKMSIMEDPVFFDKYENGKTSEKKYIKNVLNKIKTITCLQSDEINVDNIRQINFSGKNIGVSLRKLYISDYDENILDVLKYIINNGGSIIFIPHSFHKTDILVNDYIFLKKFYVRLTEKYSEKIGEKKMNISICKTLEESYRVYKNKEIDINFAQRLHSIILSQVYDIDFIGISYSKKTDETLKLLSKKD